MPSVAVTGTYGAASNTSAAQRNENKKDYSDYLRGVNEYLAAQQNAKAAVSNTDLSNPSSYLTSAFDLANYNTETSQALAREQMAFQERANAKAMDFNATEAQKTRDWTSLMSDTAHQREVRDLIAAGLNPVLSANAGASTGSAANAIGVSSNGAMGNVDMSAVAALTNAYTQAKQIEMQEKSLEMQDKSIEAQVIMNALSNETNRYAADKGAYASMYNSGVMSSANRYSASVSAAAARYAADINKSIYEEGYHGTNSVTGNLITDLFNNVESSKPINVKSLKEWVFGAPSSAKVMENPNYKSLGDSLGDFLKGILVNKNYEAVRR